MRATQIEIARHVGCSHATVSRALANHPKISDATKHRVRKVAHDLGYTRNAVVSQLMTQLRQSRSVKIQAALGYVVSFPTPQIEGTGAPNYSHYYHGAKARAEELGYHLDILWRNEPRMTRKKFDKIVATRGIRGVIIAPRPNPIGHVSLDWTRVAAAAVGHPQPRPKIHRALAGHYQIIHTALRTIMKYGYHRIGLAVFPELDRDAHLAFSSRYALHSSQVVSSERLPALCAGTSAGDPSFADFKKWYRKHRPEVIISGGPVVLGWMRELGISVPDEAALVDLSMPEPLPEIAGMCERTAVIGACAVDLVVEQLNYNRLGVPEIPKAVVVEGVWVDGKSLPRRRE